MPSLARRALLRAVVLITCGIAASQAAIAGDALNPDTTSRFLQAAQKFEEARAGSTSAVAPAQTAFKSLLDAQPSNPLFMAYYGTTFAMQARDGGFPWQKLKWVRDGIAQIDRALTLLKPEHDTEQVRGIPLSLETRLVAIATFVSLPSMFNRMSVAKQQLADVLASPLFAAASTEMRGRFIYEQALIARADGDKERERAALRQVVQYSPPSLNMNEVRDELAKLGG